MGGFGDNDVFYCKVHSPVLLIEFDLHKGVFLNNDEPKKFHIHVVVRTPNGKDYGRTCCGSIWSSFTGRRPNPPGALLELQHTIHLSHAGVERLGRHIIRRPGAQALLHTGDVPEDGGATMGGTSTCL
jgi:hypothetical protein